MKKIYAFTVALSFLAGGFAQKQVPIKITYIKCINFAITKPLSEMASLDEFAVEMMKQSDKKEIPIRRTFHPPVNPNSLPAGNDPAAQTNMGSSIMGGPIANWQGQSPSGWPPDPTGAAGPNHYVQGVNTSYKIYTKTGVAVTGGGPFNLSTLWSGSTDDGDPIVLYDKYADRWFISQFNGADQILVAVSATSNPVGSYYAYTFVPNAGVFPDYPKYSVWTDGYYCTANGGTGSDMGNMAVFDRTQMLAGNSSAGMITVTYPVVPSTGFFCPMPGDADGQLPPNGTPCPLFSYEDDSWDVNAVDQLRIYNFNTDWTTPANSSLTLDTLLPVTPFNVNFTQTWDDVTQPGTTQKLDALNGVLGFRAPYRVWTGYNSALLCYPVIVNATTKQVGIRWYELRQNSVTKAWSIYQESTYAPDANSRWTGSMAMDDNGSIAMAYAVSSSSVSPSLRYTGRISADPLGQMTFIETSAVAGTGAQTFDNRWGDYAQTTLDPDGLAFWHTGEYISGGSIKTRIFSFQIPNNVGISSKDNSPSLSYFQNENLLNINACGLPNNNEMQVDLFDIQGKQLSAQKVKPNDNKLQVQVNIAGLVPGTYLVRIGNINFQRVVKVIVN